MRNFILTVLLCNQLLLNAGAEQLYVRNRPFKGEVVRQSGKTWVEIKAFSEALGLKLEGDAQQGYQLAAEAEASPPGEGKALLHGTEIPTFSGTSGLLIPLEDACPLLGARLVSNKAMGTLDVSLAPAANPKTAASLGSSAYTLVEYGVPGQPLTKYVEPVFATARSQFKNVEYHFCNVENNADLKRYSGQTGSTDPSYPAVFLLDREGKVLLQLRGNHVIEKELIKGMRKLVNVSL